MDCTEPDVAAPAQAPDNTSINVEALEPPEIGKTSINNGKAQEVPDIGNNISINDEAADIGKTSVNVEAEQVCHNVSVPLFTAK